MIRRSAFTHGQKDRRKGCNSVLYIYSLKKWYILRAKILWAKTAVHKNMIFLFIYSSSVSNQKTASFDLWKMDSLMDSGYINTYFRGGSSNNGGSTNYPSLQAFPTTSQAGQTGQTAQTGQNALSTVASNMGPMSLLSLNISHNPKPTLTNSHSQTNLSALTSSQLPLQVFR